jgi:hypothetical protein
MSPSPSIPVMIVDGTRIPLAGVDSIITHHLSFSNVYLILKLILNLVYVDQLCNFSDYLVIFSLFVVVYKIYSLRS